MGMKDVVGYGSPSATAETGVYKHGHTVTVLAGEQGLRKLPSKTKENCETAGHQS